MSTVNALLASPVIATILGAAFTIASAILVQTFRIVRRISTLEVDVKHIKQDQHSVKINLRHLAEENDRHHHHVFNSSEQLHGEAL